MKNISTDKLSIINFLMILILIIDTILFRDIIVNLILFGYFMFAYKKFSKDASEYLYYLTILLCLFGSSAVFPISLSRGVNLWYLTLFLYYIFNIKYIKQFFLNFKKANLKNNLLKDRYIIFYIIFFLYALIGLMFVKNIGDSFAMIKLFIFTVPLAVMFILENLKENRFDKTFKFLFMVFAGILTIGLIKIAGYEVVKANMIDKNQIIYHTEDFLERIPKTFFFNQNDYAVFVAMGILALCVSYNYEKDKWSKLAHLIVYTMGQINLIFISSRTAILTLMVTLLTLLFYSLLRRDKALILTNIKFICLTSIVFMGISLFSSVQPYYGRFDNLPGIKHMNVGKKISAYYEKKDKDQDKVTSEKVAKEKTKLEDNYKRLEGQAEASSSIRRTLSKNVIKGVFVEKHLLGFGMGNTGEYIKSQDNTGGIINVHSFWVEFLGDYGVFMLLYLILIYISMGIDQLIISIKQTKFNKLGLIMCTEIYAFVFLSFGPSSVFGFTPFWIMLGLSNAIYFYSIYREDNNIKVLSCKNQ